MDRQGQIFVPPDYHHGGINILPGSQTTGCYTGSIAQLVQNSNAILKKRHGQHITIQEHLTQIFDKDR